MSRPDGSKNILCAYIHTYEYGIHAHFSYLVAVNELLLKKITANDGETSMKACQYAIRVGRAEVRVVYMVLEW